MTNVSETISIHVKINTISTRKGCEKGNKYSLHRGQCCETVTLKPETKIEHGKKVLQGLQCPQKKKKYYILWCGWRVYMKIILQMYTYNLFSCLDLSDGKRIVLYY